MRQRGNRVFQAKGNFQRTCCLDRCDLRRDNGEVRIGRGHYVERCHNVSRIERFAIMPTHIGLELHGKCQIVIGCFPRCGQTGQNSQVEAIGKQAFEHFGSQDFRSPKS